MIAGKNATGSDPGSLHGGGGGMGIVGFGFQGDREVGDLEFQVGAPAEFFGIEFDDEG